MKALLQHSAAAAALLFACNGYTLGPWQENGLGPHMKPIEVVKGPRIEGTVLCRPKPASFAAGAPGGQRLQMTLDGEWPRLILKPGLWAPWTIDLGTAAPKGVKPIIDVLKKEPVFVHEGDWTSVKISLPCELAAGASADELLPDEDDFLVHYYFTRLAPAIVVESRFSNLLLFGGAKRLRMFRGWEAFDKEITGPSHMAWAGADKTQIEAAPCETEFGLWSNPAWILVWFGPGIEYPNVAQCGGSETHGHNFHSQHWAVKPYEADCPYLLVFENPPQWAVLSPEGLGLEFPDEAGKVAMMPLRGAVYPEKKELESWRFGLPEAVQAECRYWAERFAMLPWKAVETYSRDEERDEITVALEFSHMPIGQGGVEWSPIAPALALAIDQGFPARIGSDALGRRFLTHYGPLVSIDNAPGYQIVFSGLGKYALESRGALPAGAGEESRFAQRLAGEVDKMLEAGHLAPWMPINSSQTHWEQPMFANPAETLFCLSEARQVLPENMRGKLDAYLESEQAAYPAQTTAVTPFMEGARRERYPVSAKVLADFVDLHVREFNFHVVNKLTPIENLYGLARFYADTGKKPAPSEWAAMNALLEGRLKNYDWATKGFLMLCPHNAETDRWTLFENNIHGHGGTLDLDAFFSGLLGFVRLARMAGDAEAEATGWGLFAQSAAQRFSHGKKYVYDYGEGLMALPPQPAPYWQGSGSWVGDIVLPEWLTPDDDIRAIRELNEFEAAPGNYIYRPGVGPDMLRAVKLTPELGRFYGDFLEPEFARYVAAVEHNSADWYAWQGEQFLGNDNNCIHPSDTRAIFMAKSWILDEDAATLDKYVDISALARGDLDYIHKLAEAELRRRGFEWRRQW